MQILIFILIIVVTLQNNRENKSSLISKIFEEILNLDFVKNTLSGFDTEDILKSVKEFNFEKIIKLAIDNLPTLIKFYEFFKSNNLFSNEKEENESKKNPLSPIEEIADENILNFLKEYLYNR